MKMSYKIALIVSMAVFIMAVIMFTGPADPGEATPDTTVATGEPEVAPRKSLLSDTPVVAQTPSTSSKPSGTAPPKTGRSLAQDVRSRIAAVDNDPADTPVEVASEEEPAEVAVPDAIALTRTDTDTSAHTIKAEPEPAPAISRNDLDAILGVTSTPSADTMTASTEDTVADDTKTIEASTDTQPDDGVAYAGGTYVVQPGDTFSAIAMNHYGEESKWFDIAQANPTIDPTRLRVGQELKMPAKVALPEINEPVPPGPEGVKTYTIRPGDSLSTVAKTYYGDPTLWRTIYNFNRDKIGENPNAIQAGMTVKVPPRAGGAG